MGWLYQDLTETDKEKIGFPLPADWEYSGVPGDKIWPIFYCPVCDAVCESEWGGCKHCMFIFRGSGTDGFYDYLNDKFVNIVNDTIIEMLNITNLNYDFSNFPTIHEPLAEINGEEILLKELVPEIILIEFNCSYSFYDFVDFAGFLG